MGGVHDSSSDSTHVGAGKSTSPGDPTATMDADKGNIPDFSLRIGKGTGAATDVDADKGSPADALLATDGDVDTGKGANTDDPLATHVDTGKGANTDDPLATHVDTGKGANTDDPLATHVDTGKGANPVDPLATDVDTAKSANPDVPLAGNTDNSTGKLLAAATAAPSPPIPDVALAQPPPKFDIEKAKLLIAQKDWQGLDELLCQFVDDNTGKKTQDPGVFHPGLVIIARAQKVIQLLEDEEPEVATTYADEFLKPLKTCQSKFEPLNLKSYIDDIIRMIDNRSVSSIKSIVDVDVETAISDYLLLYFRAMCQDEADHEVEGTWQFAKRLPIPENEISSPGKSQKHRPGFRCLACGWTAKGSLSISSLGYHIAHVSKSKCCFCPKVTQDMLDRLKLIGQPKLVPNLSSLAIPLKNKRKGSSSASAADQKTDSSSSALPLSVAHVDKKLKNIRSSSTTSHTVASSPPAADPAANRFSVGVDGKFILEKVAILQKISSFLMAQNKDSVILSACAQYLDKAMELERVAVELKMEAAKTGSDISVHGAQVATPNVLAGLSVGVDGKFILAKVDSFQKISSFLMAQNKDLVVLSARAQYLDKAMELERVAVELKMEAAKAGSGISVHGEMRQVATPNVLAVSAPLPVEMPPETQDEA